MTTCGMHAAGDGCFAGIPAKSGVGGGILGVVNRQTESALPALDAKGNSVRRVSLRELPAKPACTHSLLNHSSRLPAETDLSVPGLTAPPLAQAGPGGAAVVVPRSRGASQRAAFSTCDARRCWQPPRSTICAHRNRRCPVAAHPAMNNPERLSDVAALYQAARDATTARDHLRAIALCEQALSSEPGHPRPAIAQFWRLQQGGGVAIGLLHAARKRAATAQKQHHSPPRTTGQRHPDGGQRADHHAEDGCGSADTHLNASLLLEVDAPPLPGRMRNGRWRSLRSAMNASSVWAVVPGRGPL
jgi:hypothetical protein